MKWYILLLPIVSLVVSVSVLQADTILVPSQESTIQAGIDEAVDGDTVLVADGTYTGDGNRDIRFGGKGVVLMSEKGPANCIVDCEGSAEDYHRGFFISHGEDSNTVVQGFTITNGYMTGWPSGDGRGGAIFCVDSSPTIINNIISGNTAYHGGGINSYYFSSPIIKSNTISGNTAYEGGGFCSDNSYASISGNLITENYAEHIGGGIYCYYYAEPIIIGNKIMQNSAHEGAAIGILLSKPIVTSNIIMGNRGGYGGGISCYDSSPNLISNTITGNRALEWGGGIYCINHSNMTISNTILWSNNASNGSEIWIGSYNDSSVVTISYSDVAGGSSSVYIRPGCTLNWGDGIMDEDPTFVLSDKDDYRLLWDSPCIDAGNPTLFDPDGTRSDMGAHYFNQNDHLTLYLTPDTTDVAPGGHLGVTYTAINRWTQPEPFWVLSQVLLPGGSWLSVLGPDQYTLPADYTAQVHITHPIPNNTPTGMYEYRSLIGIPPGTLYDRDSFRFWVIE